MPLADGARGRWSLVSSSPAKQLVAPPQVGIQLASKRLVTRAELAVAEAAGPNADKRTRRPEEHPVIDRRGHADASSCKVTSSPPLWQLQLFRPHRENASIRAVVECTI